MRLLDSLFGKSKPFSGNPAVDGYNATREASRHSSFCFAPSVNMYFAQDGQVKVCCHNNDYSVGNYPKQTLKEIWNSKEAGDFRENLRKYTLPKSCGYCEADFKSGNYNEISAKHFDYLPVHGEYPTMMEFLLTNTCNLECVMCQGEFSSLIRKNRDKLPPIHNPYDKAFLEQLEEFIPYLKETRFSGSGEAFSIDMNYDIWERLIAVNPDCLIVVQTNGTILTGRGKEIMSKGKFQIGVSLDSLKKDVFEAIRINANFDKVMENIKYFHAYCQKRKTPFRISTCVMRQNWRELPDFINYCNSMNAIATFHKVWAPREFALYNLPAPQLEEIHTYLSSFEFSTNTLRERNNRNHYLYFVSVIKQWLDAAKEREHKFQEASTLNSSELLPLIMQRWESHIAITVSDIPKQQQQLESYLRKLDELVNRFQTSTEKDELLRRISALQPNEILDSFDKHTIDFIYDKSMEALQNEFTV